MTDEWRVGRAMGTTASPNTEPLKVANIVIGKVILVPYDCPNKSKKQRWGVAGVDEG